MGRWRRAVVLLGLLARAAVRTAVVLARMIMRVPALALAPATTIMTVVAGGRAKDRVVLENESPTTAVAARLRECLDEAGAEPLAGELDQAERGDLGDLVTGAVAAERLGETAHDEVLIGLEHHVDEVDDDHAADIAQAHLPHDLLGSFEVVAGDRLFEVAARTGELAGVDVDDCHRLGPVDDERAARGQPHRALERLVELLVDAVHAEHVDLVVIVALEATLQLGGELGDIVVDRVPRLLPLHDELVEVLVEQVAHDLHEEIGLGVEVFDRRALALLEALGIGGDLLPFLRQPLDVAADVLLGHALCGGPDNDPVTGGDNFLEDRLEALALGVRELA